MEPVMQSAGERLFQYGVLGILVVVFAVVIYSLWKESARDRREYIQKLEELQQQRVADAKAVQATMVEIAQKSTEALNTVTAAATACRETMLEVRETLRDFGDDIRNMRGGTGRGR